MAMSDIQRWTGFSAPQAAMLRLKLSNEGYVVTQWTDRVGAFYGLHFHPEEQVHWVISGEVEITTKADGKNNVYRLKSGDRDLIKPNIFHTLRQIGETELLYLVGVKRVIGEPKVEAIEPIIEIVEPIKIKTAKVKTTKPKAKSTTKKTKTKKKI